MSPTERIFASLEKLVDSYAVERKNKISDETVLQGRNISAGSNFQLNLAKELFSQSKDYKVLVDYPLSFGKYETKTGKLKTKSLYADIIVTKRCILKGIIEVKIDLGFLRCEDFGLSKGQIGYQYTKSENKFKANYDSFLSSKEFRYKFPVGFKKPKSRTIQIPKNNDKVAKIFLIVTKKNCHNRFESLKKAVQDSGFRFLCLLQDTHPNEQTNLCQDLDQWSSEIKQRIRNELDERSINVAFKSLLQRNQS